MDLTSGIRFKCFDAENAHFVINSAFLKLKQWFCGFPCLPKLLEYTLLFDCHKKRAKIFQKVLSLVNVLSDVNIWSDGNIFGWSVVASLGQFNHILSSVMFHPPLEFSSYFLDSWKWRTVITQSIVYVFMNILVWHSFHMLIFYHHSFLWLFHFTYSLHSSNHQTASLFNIQYLHELPIN